MSSVSGDQKEIREKEREREREREREKMKSIKFIPRTSFTVYSIYYIIISANYSLLPERSFSNSASALSISGSSILIIVFMSTVLKMYSINIYII